MFLAETLQPLHPRPFPLTHQKPGPSSSPPRPQPGVRSAPQRPHRAGTRSSHMASKMAENIIDHQALRSARSLLKCES